MSQRAIIGINGDLIPYDETLNKLSTHRQEGSGGIQIGVIA